MVCAKKYAIIHTGEVRASYVVCHVCGRGQGGWRGSVPAGTAPQGAGGKLFPPGKKPQEKVWREMADSV